MGQHYRNQSGRSDYGRGGRHQSGHERDRYRTGSEHRFETDWSNPNERAFEGDRSYAGGYSEEFGYRNRNRDESDRELRSRNYRSRGTSGANYQSARDSAMTKVVSTRGIAGPRAQAARTTVTTTGTFTTEVAAASPAGTKTRAMAAVTSVPATTSTRAAARAD